MHKEKEPANCANCANHLITKLCDKRIIERNPLRETQGDDIHCMGGNEMLEEDKQKFEIAGQCPNFLQRSVKP